MTLESLEGLLRTRTYLEAAVYVSYQRAYGSPILLDGGLDPGQVQASRQFAEFTKQLAAVNALIHNIELNTGSATPQGRHVDCLPEGQEQTKFILIDPDGTEVLVKNKAG